MTGRARSELRRKLVFYAGLNDRALRAAWRDSWLATCEVAQYEGVSIPRSLRRAWARKCAHDPFAPGFVRPRAWGRFTS